jgi:hypothetical protein
MAFSTTVSYQKIVKGAFLYRSSKEKSIIIHLIQIGKIFMALPPTFNSISVKNEIISINKKISMYLSIYLCITVQKYNNKNNMAVKINGYARHIILQNSLCKAGGFAAR